MDRILELSENQTNTILYIFVNLHWDLLREILNDWSDMDKTKETKTIKKGLKLLDDFQELESIIRGVPIK